MLNLIKNCFIQESISDTLK